MKEKKLLLVKKEIKNSIDTYFLQLKNNIFT